jgi:hypothetical protein
MESEEFEGEKLHEQLDSDATKQQAGRERDKTALEVSI